MKDNSFITYYDFALSKMNNDRNEFFKDGVLTLNANYTLMEMVKFLMSEKVDKKGEGLGVNQLGLPYKELVSWWVKDMDAPLDFTEQIYTAFIARYFYRPINQNTLDLHLLKLYQFFIERKQALILKFKAYTQYTIDSENENSSEGDGGTTVTTTFRGAVSTVPENEVDLDLAKTDLPYADNFGKTVEDVETKNTGGNTNTTRNAQGKDLSKFIDVEAEMASIFRDADKSDLFLMVM